MFFVDEEPNKGWGHNCRYFYMPTSSEFDSSPLSFSGQFPKVNLSFRPISPVNRYGSAAYNCFRVPRTNTNAANPVAGRTYAVILSGGINKMANYQRYWNDCSYIYQTLVNKYNIPYNNIRVLMGDGQSPEADMRRADGQGFMSSPLDLDFNGTVDINYAATYANLRNVLYSLRSTLTEEDHLFIYVIDHGGTNNNAGSSYICLWNGDIMQDDEFGSIINSFNVRSVNVLLGQCYSGGFIDNLQKNGTVVATACAADEPSWACTDIPYDEFVFQWTNAVNERVGNTSQTISSDVNKSGFVAMDEAFSYAKANDRASETPMFSSTPLQVGEDLAFNNIPLGVDLYIRDNIYDTGKEPSPATLNYWGSPDIWVRSTDDGFENQEDEMIVYDPQKEARAYCYFRVTNRGTKDYITNDKYLHPYYANKSFPLYPNTWTGYTEIEPDSVFGGIIVSPMSLNQVIPAGESRIFRKSWTLSDNDGLYVYFKNKGKLDINILGILSNKRDGSPFDEYQEIDSCINISRLVKTIAQKNKRFIKVGSAWDTTDLYLHIGDTIHDYLDFIDLEMSIADGSKTPDEANVQVTMQLTPTLYQSWMAGGNQGSNIAASGMKVLLRDNGSKISNLQLISNTPQKLQLCVSRKPGVLISRTDTLTYCMLIRNHATGEVLAGEDLVILIDPNTANSVHASYELTADGYELTASDIGEPATYSWYNENGEAIGYGSSVNVPLEKYGKYKVKAMSNSNKTFSEDEVDINNAMVIESISPIPMTDVLTINLATGSTGKSKVRITSVQNQAVSEEYSLPAGDKALTINTATYPNGIYAISLIENDKIVDTKKISK